MTAYRQAARVEEIVHVSANLRADGGGAAHFGRLVGRALRRYGAARGLAVRGLHLPAADGDPALDGYASFAGRRGRLAAALVRLQAAGGRRRVLVFDHPGPARVQGRFAALARSRYAVALLGVDVWRQLEPDRRRALGGAAALLAISRQTAERARPFLPAGCRIAVVHPGLEPAAAGGAPDRALLAALGSGFALVVSRLAAAERYKGHDELLAAWPALAGRLPDARLVVAGEGDDRARLEQQARALGLGARVRFTGAVDGATLEELYRRCALFAMPSRDEGFGLVFLEAMAAGRACLALAGTAPAEIVVDGETGRLVAPGDGAALVDALAALLADAGLAGRLGRAGRARFEREFTGAAFERRLAPHLDRLVRGGD